MASTDLETVTSTNEPVKYRNLFAQALLTIVTIGLYVIYWFYATARELSAITRRDEPVVLWTILLFVPIISAYSYYKYGELFEQISPDMNRWILFLLWFFFPPAVWIIVQLKLNRIALEKGAV